jgi:hypothetical protein
MTFGIKLAFFTELHLRTLADDLGCSPLDTGPSRPMSVYPSFAMLAINCKLIPLKVSQGYNKRLDLP